MIESIQTVIIIPLFHTKFIIYIKCKQKLIFRFYFLYMFLLLIPLLFIILINEWRLLDYMSFDIDNFLLTNCFYFFLQACPMRTITVGTVDLPYTIVTIAAFIPTISIGNCYVTIVITN